MEVIAGLFLQNRVLGAGAAGEVVEAVLAKDAPYGRRGDVFALKRYKPGILGRPDQATRILRELRVGTEIQSPHVVRSYAIEFDGKSPVLVMQRLHGQTLRDWLHAHPPPSYAQIRSILADVMEGLSALHERGLIHRDVKPENIMMTEAGAVVMDLGVVRDMQETTLLSVPEFVGTIRYSAPECLFGGAYDARSDVHSVGLILWEMVAGTPAIDPKLMWSRQVLAKEEARRTAVPAEALRRFTLREWAFLDVLLEGMLHSDHDFYWRARAQERPPSRLSSFQIRDALRNRADAGVFFHPPRKLVEPRPQREAVMASWPLALPEWEPQVSNFLARAQGHDLERLARWMHVDLLRNGVYAKEVRADEGTERSVALALLAALGAVQSRTEYSSEDEPWEKEYDLYTGLTELGWQLVLRGILLPTPDDPLPEALSGASSASP